MGPFEVRVDRPDPHAPYSCYTVCFAGTELGKQISHPTLADCFEQARRAIAANKVAQSIAEQLYALGVVGAPVLRIPARRRHSGEERARCNGAANRRHRV